MRVDSGRNYDSLRVAKNAEALVDPTRSAWSFLIYCAFTVPYGQQSALNIMLFGTSSYVVGLFVHAISVKISFC